MTGKLLAGAQEDCGEQVGRQLDHLSLINEALPLAETSAVEVLIEADDPRLADDGGRAGTRAEDPTCR
jgi:hypothetical protein